MKSYLLIFIILTFCTQKLLCQIKIIDVVINEPIDSNYDSLINFVTTPNAYIGQSLYLKPKSKILREYGYRDFYRQKDGKPVKSYNAIPYDELQGITFKAIDCQKVSTSSVSESILKLIYNEDLDTIYFKFDPLFEHSFPFLTLGYLEKLKSKYINKKFVGRSDVSEKYTETKVGDVWTIDDIVLENQYFNLQFNMKHSTGKIYPFDMYDIIEANYSDFYPFNAAQKLKTKYGSVLYNDALKGYAKIGMSKELATMAWGEPDEINKTTSSSISEQWVYDSGSYLYFTNGKLSSIQN